MFEGFREFDIATAGTTIHGRCGGHGPPVLLLHGIPETHLMWHRVAPRSPSAAIQGYADAGALNPALVERANEAIRAVLAELPTDAFSVATLDLA